MQTIELSEDSVKILDSYKLSDRHKILVSVSVDNMSFEQATQYLTAVTESFKKVVEPASVLVYPNSIGVTIIEQ